MQLPGHDRIASDGLPTVDDAKLYALQALGPREYNCFYWVIWYESRWRPYVWNGLGSGAYGLPQAKPGSKMASAGADWKQNPITQVKWAMAYMDHKYGSACGALAWWSAHGNY